MNRERLLRVADAIEKHEIEWLGFNMGTYYTAGQRHLDRFGLADMSGHDCDTVACIAGTAVALKLRDQTECGHLAPDGYNIHDRDIISMAISWLGLTVPESNTLFYAHDSPFESKRYAGGPDDIRDVSSVHAVKTLRHAAKTGEIDWSVALEDEG